MTLRVRIFPPSAYLAVALLVLAMPGCDDEPDDRAGRVRKAISDPAGYVKQLEAECERGRAASCTAIGVQHAFGTYGRKRDLAAALPFLKRGCEGGDAYGCKELGVMYRHGRGIAKDPAAARRHLDRACDENIAAACHDLGEMCAQGEGVDADAAKAAAYFKRACAAGSNASCER